MRPPKPTSTPERGRSRARGFTLLEAVLAIAILSIGLVSLLLIRSNAVEKSRRTLLLRAAQRLAVDLAGEIEAGVFGEPEVGRVEYGIFVDNRMRYRKPGRYKVSRVEYSAYPENEDEASYPPGLKFEWEVTEDGAPAEEIPSIKVLNDDATTKRFEERWRISDEIEREMSYREGGSTGDSSSDPLGANDPLAEEEEDEDKTEEWRTLTVFVRCDTSRRENELLFELERRFLWTYPDRVPKDESDEELGSSAQPENGAGR